MRRPLAALGSRLVPLTGLMIWASILKDVASTDSKRDTRGDNGAKKKIHRKEAQHREIVCSVVHAVAKYSTMFISFNTNDITEMLYQQARSPSSQPHSQSSSIFSPFHLSLRPSIRPNHSLMINLPRFLIIPNELINLLSTWRRSSRMILRRPQGLMLYESSCKCI